VSVKALTQSGRLRLGGDLEAIERWLPIIGQYHRAMAENLNSSRQVRQEQSIISTSPIQESRA